jgi:hypothetical protein
MKTFVIIAILFFTTSLAGASGLQKTGNIPDHVKSVKAVIPIYSQKVAFQMPTSWKPAFKDQKQNFFIVEFTPKDEEINSWQNMLSVQGFQNLASRVTPKRFLSEIAEKFKSVCGSNAIFEPLGEESIDGFQAYSAILGCAGLPNQNISEVGYYLSIQGEKDLYVIHKSIRTVAFDPEESPLTKFNADDFIAEFMPVELCNKGGGQGACNK